MAKQRLYEQVLDRLRLYEQVLDRLRLYEQVLDRLRQYVTEGGLKAGDRLPPEGLHWVYEVQPEERPPHLALLDLVRERPVAAPGVVLDVSAARPDGTWTYTEYETPGTRLIIPWTARGLPPGEARLDFARDERLPELAVWTAVPRGDGTGRTVVRTPSRELSLAWKLLWLHADCAGEGHAQAKDLYDAVLLAEAEGTRLSPRLLREVFRREPGDTAVVDALRLDAVVPHSVDWERFLAEHPRVEGTAQQWLERLRRALGRMAVAESAVGRMAVAERAVGRNRR